MRVLHFSFQGNRDYQEDRVFIDADNNVFAICDGVGGSKGGAIASDYVIHLIEKNVSTLAKISCVSELEKVLRFVHDKMIEKYTSINLGQSYATTIAILTINNDTAFVSNIGDTKIYNISGGMHWISKDHSAVQELYDVGILTSEREMLNHPFRNRITSSLSTSVSPDELLINTEQFDISHKTPRFIIASDGALEKWTNKRVVNHFSCDDDVLHTKWKLFEDLASKSNDNSSAILVH